MGNNTECLSNLFVIAHLTNQAMHAYMKMHTQDCQVDTIKMRDTFVVNAGLCRTVTKYQTFK